MTTESPITVEIEWTFAVLDAAADGDSDALVEHVGEVMDRLLDLEACADATIADPALSLDTGVGTVLVELLATGPTYPEAANAGLSAIRAAIHAAGGSTPRWPSLADMLRPGNTTINPVHADVGSPLTDETRLVSA